MIKFIDAFSLTETARGAMTQLRECLSQTQTSDNVTFTLTDLSGYASGQGLNPELRSGLLERVGAGDVVIGLNPSGDASFDFAGSKVTLWSGEVGPLVDQLCRRYSLQKVAEN